MTRKKQREKGDGHFAHSPFRGLKGFVAREAAPAAPLRDHPAAATDSGQDDAELFIRTVGPVNRGGRRPPAPQKTVPPRRCSSGSEDQDRALFLESLAALEKVPSDHPGEPEGSERRTGPPARRMKLLRRGVIRIDAELDLHGLVAEDAISRLAVFLESARRRSAAAVLVITGKGLNSPSGPVLPGAVVKWLKGPGKGIISEFAPAPRDKGGSGAIVVFLKK